MSTRCSITSITLLAEEGCFLCPLIANRPNVSNNASMFASKVSGRAGQRQGQI